MLEIDDVVFKGNGTFVVQSGVIGPCRDCCISRDSRSLAARDIPNQIVISLIFGSSLPVALGKIR